MSIERISQDNEQANEVVHTRTALEKSGGFDIYEAIAGQYETLATDTIIRAQAAIKLQDNMRGTGSISRNNKTVSSQ